MKISKSKTMAKYVTAVAEETDVVAFVCSAQDVAALRAAFRRQKKEGQRLTFRTQGDKSYGIVAMESQERKVKNGTSENGMS